MKEKKKSIEYFSVEKLSERKKKSINLILLGLKGELSKVCLITLVWIKSFDYK